jgi:riboflavin kinase/FMN adenylyltransferase
MQVHKCIDKLPAFANAVVTIGSFDGVHTGHRQIIEALTNEARNVGGESVIITFDPHPKKIVHPNEPLQLINTQQEKIELLARTGVDHLVIAPFNQAFAEQTAEEYISCFLFDRFHPHSIIIGYDHHFGKGRTGDFALLQQKAGEYNYKLLEIPKHVLNEIAVSSTKIRRAILESAVEIANELLGYDFFFEGEVVKGDQLGRELGYPTANLLYTDAEKIRLGHGVYAVYVQVKDELRKGMLSIGNRPTLSASKEKVEVNIFDFDQQLYGETIRVIVKKYLRAQEKYNSLSELTSQLQKDKEQSLEVL